MENNQLAVINSLPSSKTEQRKFVEALVGAVLEGEKDPLKVEAQMKSLEDIVKEYRKNPEIRDLLLDEVRKYPKGVAEFYNATFQEKEVGVKYDFSQCGLAPYNELCQKIDELSAKKKEYEDMMKAHKDTWLYTDMETGEQCEVNPPFRTATAQVVVTLKK